MKNSKKLKLILNILICILIILIGIVGIYTKFSNMYKNIFPHNYTLGSDINGATVIQFTPDETKETIYYDKDGNEVDASEVTDKNKENYKSEEIYVNPSKNLNENNYNISLKIMEERLKLIDADQYKLDLDETTGIITLTVEDDYLEDIESILPMEGNLQLIDEKTEEVIIDYDDFKSAEASYASLTTKVLTYINIKLNDVGIEKINDIDKYKNVTSEDGEEVEESKIIVQFDSDTIAEVSYDDILLTGKKLRITTSSNLTSDSDINSQINLDTIASKLATIGKMPVIYNITAEEFVENDLGEMVNYIVGCLIIACLVASLILICKYNLKGILAVIGFATNVSIFLSIIRLAEVQISLNCFAGMLGLIVLNFILMDNILKYITNKEKVFLDNIKGAYLKTLDVIAIMLIILVVFAFSSMTVISTMGLLLFWGWLVTLLGTLIFTVPMLAIITNK